jgi:multisubunit Na+/H+ antiporter MnhC subunit
VNGLLKQLGAVWLGLGLAAVIFALLNGGLPAVFSENTFEIILGIPIAIVAVCATLCAIGFVAMGIVIGGKKIFRVLDIITGWWRGDR